MNKASTENAKAEIQKSHNAFQAALALGRLRLFDDAASRLYYSAFHMVSAALFCVGVQVQTHSGVASMLGLHLIKSGLLPSRIGRDFSVLLALRNQSDYERHFILDGEGFDEELERSEYLYENVASFLRSNGLDVAELPSKDSASLLGPEDKEL